MENKTKKPGIYVKAEKNKQITHPKVIVEDVATVYCQNKGIEKRAKKLVLYTCNKNKDMQMVFSVVKLVALLEKEFPNVEIINLGESDFIVEYRIPKKKSRVWEYIKIAVAVAILFFGSAFTIMTFNTDVAVADVFDMAYELIIGKKKTGGSVLEIAYSVGLVIGILGFYNHFSSRKKYCDPTPLQMEMRAYEEELDKAIIKDAAREGKTLDV